MTPEELDTAIKEFKEMFDSAIYQEYLNDMDQFVYMMNHAIPEFTTDLAVIDKWYEENWQRSQYKSLEELSNARKSSVDKLNQAWSCHQNLFALITRASVEELGKINAPYIARAMAKLGR